MYKKEITKGVNDMNVSEIKIGLTISYRGANEVTKSIVEKIYGDYVTFKNGDIIHRGNCIAVIK